MYFVYELVDPRTDVTGYVGITNNPNKRYSEHIEGRENKGKKYEWIKCLQREQTQPKMNILEIVDNLKHARIQEQYWIQHYISKGVQLTNVRLNETEKRARTEAREQQTSLIKASHQQANDYYTESEVREILNIDSSMLATFIEYRLIFRSKTGYYDKSKIDKFRIDLRAFCKSYGVDTLNRFYG